MKHIYLLLILFFIIPSLYADEFKILNFEKAEGDLSAINQKYRRTDANDIVCAIIKVRSDLKGLHFEASNPVVGDIERKSGEYWVYVSGRTRELSFFADGFIKFSYTFPQFIQARNVYILTITSQTGKVVESGKGSLNLTSNPTSVSVSIDGFPDLYKQTPCSFENYRAGKYKFYFSRKRYHTYDTIINIIDNTQKQLNINLRPLWGNLQVETSLDNVLFEINDNQYKGSILNLIGENNGLMPGDYYLTISKTNYHSIIRQVKIQEAQLAKYNIALLPINTNVSITSIPSGAHIFMDDAYLGITPLNEEMIIGQHNLRILKEGYLDEKLIIALEEGKSFEKEIELRNHTKIQIYSEPKGAKVSINGIYKGETPLKTEVKTGINKIRLQKEYYQLHEAEIDIGHNQTYSFDLKPRQYNLKIISRKAADANIIINDKPTGQTPKTIKSSYGKYRVKLEKEGYYSASKRVKLKSDHNLTIKMNKRLVGYLGISWVPKQNDYELNKVGFEIGWSYKKAPNLFTGFSFLFNIADDISYIIPANVIGVNSSEYDNMCLETMPKEGFAELEAYFGSIKWGLIIPKPFVFTLGVGVGLYYTRGYYVYRANGNYQVTTNNNNNNIFFGDLIYDKEKDVKRNELVYGVNMFIPIGPVYIMGEYWVSNNFVNFSPEYSLGIGYAFDH